MMITQVHAGLDTTSVTNDGGTAVHDGLGLGCSYNL